MKKEALEPRKAFHQQLDDLYYELLRMMVKTLDILEETRKAFKRLDVAKASEVINHDDVIDFYRSHIEEEGIELLARQAPVASDLRLIVVIMRMAQHLERVADLCVNICKAIKNLEGIEISTWIQEGIETMFEHSKKMLTLTMEAFMRMNLDLVDNLNQMDEKIDHINRSFFTAFDKDSSKELDLIIRVVMISRFIERIADHAVDMGEHLRFLVTGHAE